jgi:hypothetical protein
MPQHFNRIYELALTAAKFVLDLLTKSENGCLEFYVKIEGLVVSHPPYSPHLVLCKFFLFLKLLLTLKIH